MKNNSKFKDLDIIGKTYSAFIENIDENSIIDFEFSRLKEVKARSYYKMFIENSSTKSLNENVNIHVKYYNELIENNQAKIYIGKTYGEEQKDTPFYNNGRKVYIDLSKKTEKEIVNLVIVKLKMESDFISFKLNKFYTLMMEYDLISEEEYNLAVYGTNDVNKLALIKMGLPINVIIQLEKDDQLKNIDFDVHGNLAINDDFKSYKSSLDDFFAFQLDKYL